MKPRTAASARLFAPTDSPRKKFHNPEYFSTNFRPSQNRSRDAFQADSSPARQNVWSSKSIPRKRNFPVFSYESNPSTSLFPAFPRRFPVQPPPARPQVKKTEEIMVREEMLRFSKYWDQRNPTNVVKKFAIPGPQPSEMMDLFPGQSAACLFCDVVGPGLD
jgi:hypothetical protein